MSGELTELLEDENRRDESVIENAIETEQNVSGIINDGDYDVANTAKVKDIQIENKNFKLYVVVPDGRNWVYKFDLENSVARKEVKRLFDNCSVDYYSSANLIGKEVPVYKYNDSWYIQIPKDIDGFIYNLGRKYANTKYTNNLEFKIPPKFRYVFSLFLFLNIGVFTISTLYGLNSTLHGLGLFLLMFVYIIPAYIFVILISPGTYVVREGKPADIPEES